VQVVTPSGSATTLSATSASNGVANVSYPINRRSTAGNYAVKVTANAGSMSNSATLGFVVQ
jgi:hypothetical protein